MRNKKKGHLGTKRQGVNKMGLYFKQIVTSVFVGNKLKAMFSMDNKSGRN